MESIAKRIKEISEKVVVLNEAINLTIGIRQNTIPEEISVTNLVLGKLLNEREGLTREFDYLMRLKQL